MAKILIADDSQFMRGVIMEIIKKEGHEIIEATTGSEVMEKIESDKPDLLLLDIIMPEMDGTQVLQKIGSTQKTIVISAIGQEKMVEEAKTLGAFDYIVKPFEEKKVLEAVQKALAE